MKAGLVLSGGGARGAYQLGVWRYLRESGRRYDVVAGTSVGALNGALYAMGDYDRAVDLWRSIEAAEMRRIDPWEALKTLAGMLSLALPPSRAVLGRLIAGEVKGVLDPAYLESLTNQYLDYKAITAPGAPELYICATPRGNRGWQLLQHALRVRTGKQRYFRARDLGEEDLRRALLASAAIPFVFPPVSIERTEYVDGLVYDNTPYEAVRRAGCHRALVVYLDGGESLSALDYGSDAVEQIHPSSVLGPTLDFEHRAMEQSIALGYADARRILGAVDETQHQSAAAHQAAWTSHERARSHAERVRRKYRPT